MTEGYGVTREERMTNVLEANSGIEHLNFGTGGTFSPLQYELLYKHLAGKFEHDRVLIGILPYNDFSDGAYENAKTKFNARYRPYYVRSGDEFEIVYHQPTLAAAQQVQTRGRLGKTLTATARKFSATYHVLGWLKHMRVYRQIRSEEERTASHFFDFDEEEFQIMAKSVENIAKAAGQERSTTVVLLPTYLDLSRDEQEQESPLGARFATWSSDFDVHVIDLLPLMWRAAEGDFAKFYRVCDSHFNALGNKVAAELIYEALYRDTVTTAGASRS